MTMLQCDMRCSCYIFLLPEGCEVGSGWVGEGLAGLDRGSVAPGVCVCADGVRVWIVGHAGKAESGVDR